jgi:hypothetical protein
MPHEKTRRDKEVSAALTLAISQNQKQAVTLLIKTGHTEYRVTLLDGTIFIADSVSYNEQAGEIAFVLKKRVKVRIAKEPATAVTPKETFLGLGNLFNVIAGAIKQGLESIQTFAQKGITTCIEVVAEIFITSLKIGDQFNSLNEEALEEFFGFCDDLSRIWELLSEQLPEDEYSYDLLATDLAIDPSVFRNYHFC